MTTNIFPIEIDFNEYFIYKVPYAEETLRGLREEYNNTHSFFRYGTDIYVSNKLGTDDQILGTQAKVDTYKDDRITSSLIRHLFFRSFRERFPNIIPVDFYPFRIYSTQEKDDLISDLLPNNLKGVIAFKKLVEVQVRLFNTNGRKFFGLVVSTSRTWSFNKNCRELHSEGFNLIGMNVLNLVKLPGLENVLAPDEELIGTIKEVSGDIAIVDTNDGKQDYALTDLMPQKTKFNITSYLDFVLPAGESTRILADLERKKRDINNSKNSYLEVMAIVDLLALHKPIDDVKEQYQYSNKDGFYFTISPKPLTLPNSLNLRSPTFIFDHSGNKTVNTYPDRGLTEYGPYDSYIFDVKKPNILCICLKGDRGHFSQFLGNLFDGLPQSNFFRQGFRKKYNLTDIDYIIAEVAKPELTEYNKVLSSLNGKPDLVIIQIPDSFKSLDDTQNPYYQLKAQFLSLEIPVQFILSSKVGRHDEYLLNAIGLQLYAKLGGTPWVLPSGRSIDREIVVGIGHSLIRDNLYSGATTNRVVGISTFFSSDGQYLLSNKAKDVPFDEYFDELLNNLSESFSRLKDEQGWRQGDTIRLIFHIFKPIKNVEFDVISKLILKYDMFKIQFAFVTISKTHPFKLYDPSQSGISKFGRLLGEYIPPRGSNLVLDDASCVVQMLGASELKTDRHGASDPLLIRVRLPQGDFDTDGIKDLLFTDLSYIVQQIYSFTYLSWRTFLPNEQPATMLYSNLIAKLLGKLRKIDGWNPTVLNFNLKRKKWFL